MGEEGKREFCISSVDYTVLFISIMSYLWGHRYQAYKFVVKPEQVLRAFWPVLCVVPTFYEELSEGKIAW